MATDTSEMTYTMEPFERDYYWVIASDDLSEFMAAALEIDPQPRIVFFEVEEKAREVSLMEVTPEGIRGHVIRLNKERCLEVLEGLQEAGFLGAIALENGLLQTLTIIPLGSDGEGEA